MSLTPPLSMFSLEGKRALVTGASRGLGQALALGLAGAGAEVTVTARSLLALEETLSRLAKAGRPGRALALDQRDTGQIAEVLTDCAFDILINNAGVEEICPATEVSGALWDKIVDTNLKGAFFTSQAVAKGMLARGEGAIVNLCSLTSFIGVPTAVPYGSSKSGLLGMTRALAAEWGGQGVRVNAIAPGYFRTEMTEVFYQDEAWAGSMIAKIPQRRFGEAGDLVGAAIFLASGASAYITGQCLGIDGGFLASV